MRVRTAHRTSATATIEPAAFEFCAGATLRLPEPTWAESLAPEAVNALLAGGLLAPASRWHWRPEPAVWHEAPDTGKRWPLDFFGDIPYRPGNLFGDVRLAWEPARLQQLVGLARIVRAGETALCARAATMLENQLLSWCEANPPLRGIHYISAMECGLRVLAVCHALDLARGHLFRPHAVWTALVGLVQSHAELIADRLSLYSSAGNHTIAEAAGLVYAGTLFPELSGAAVWRRDGLALLEQEAERQILLDGGGAEQAFGYLRGVRDLYALVAALLRRRDESLPPRLEAAADRATAFLAAMTGATGRLPAIGDDDGGRALAPLALPAASPARPVTVYDAAGYALVHDAKADARLLFDFGPLGLPPSYGHGHADALSVVFTAGGRELLIDPGSGGYADLPWRDYFRSTRAHNTVTVDQRDQALPVGPFLWSRPYGARLVRREALAHGGCGLLAHHDGYRGLKQPVDHWRALLYRPGSLWVIWDYLAGSGAHVFDLHWHLGVAAEEVWPGRYVLDPDRPVTLRVIGGEVTRHRAESDPILGWRAPSYARRMPITTVRARHHGVAPHEFITLIQIGSRPISEPAIAEDLALVKDWVNAAAAH